MKMDENFTRGYCQLRSETPRVESRPPPGVGMESERTAPPRDRCSCIYLALVICGAGFLLPYNSFITAVDYYQAKYPGSTIIFDISLTYICVGFAGVVINNSLVELFDLNFRITFGYIISITTMLLVAICDIWFELFTPATSYDLTLIAVASVALGCTFQQSSLYGFTSMLPQRYTQAVMTGESAAGLLVSINRILTKAMLNNDQVNTLIFFSVSIGIVVLCCITFHVTRRTDFVRFFVSMCENAGLADDQRGITSQCANPEEVSLVDIMDGTVSRDSYGVLVIQTPTTPTEDIPYPQYSSTSCDNRPSSPATLPVNQSEVAVKSQGRAYKKHVPVWTAIKRGCWSRYQVARTVWPYMTAITMAYLVTLSLFPGIESEVVSCTLHSWMPVLLIGTFNLMDFIGKIIASVPYDWLQGRLVLCTVCRIILVPLLMLCAAPRAEPFLTGEGWSVVLSAILGISNGYFGSVPMILAPSKVPDEQKELTGNIMTLSLNLGLTLGSVVAYLLNMWLGPHLGYDPCNPSNTTMVHDLHNVTELRKVLSEITGQ